MNRVPVGRVLAEFRFREGVADVAQDRLMAAGLLLPNGSELDGTRLREVRKFLSAARVAVCGDPHCEQVAMSSRPDGLLARVDKSDCEVCGGSANQLGVARLVDVLRAANLSHVVVVGGGPVARNYLDGYYKIDWGPDQGWRQLFRLVDGTARHTEKVAKANLTWADLVIIWGPAMLGHDVSGHYTRSPRRHALTVTVMTTGIAGMCQEVIGFLDERSRLARS